MNLPTADYRRTIHKIPEKLHQGLDSWAFGMVGWYQRLKHIEKRFEAEGYRIHDMADNLRTQSDKRLRDCMARMRELFRLRRINDELVSEALSLIVEAADRTLGLRPYPVQIMGALALYYGYLAEMATGEGKTLTAVLPATLAGWTGRACHIITVNDYLAGRDAENMSALYSYCGLMAGCVPGQMEAEERRQNYSRNVVYTTSKEIVADFLRDRLALGSLAQPARRTIRKMLSPQWRGPENMVMRGLDTAIVDEADSVLIDEAVTPLIISRQTQNKPYQDVYQSAQKIADELTLGQDYHLNLRYKEIELKQSAYDKIRQLSNSLPGIWRGDSRRVELINQALSAKEYYHPQKQYVVQDGKVVIVDEFTGRLMPNRTWRHGLHQAIEAKENIDITSPTETLSRISFQRFFRFFNKLSGMTGTAKEASNEFWHIYRLQVMSIPTNRPCIRRLRPDRVYADTEQKYRAIVDHVIALNQSERPVLIGTRSVSASEKLAKMFDEKGLRYNLLNAVRHSEEAKIVAAAGEGGAITIATNMAGRGTDIKLGRGIAELGGLHVIASERHESGRIDRQLFGRCARQGDPGSAQSFICAEDELIQRFLPSYVHQRLVNAIEQESPAAKKFAAFAISMAQRAAQKLAFRQRRGVLQMDTWLEESLGFTGSTF